MVCCARASTKQLANYGEGEDNFFFSPKDLDTI